MAPSQAADMDVQAYLERIRYHQPLAPGVAPATDAPPTGDPPSIDPPSTDLPSIDAPSIDVPSIDLLRSLHRAHLFTVPFENLDIGLGRAIVCDETCILHKIVREHRGGFCYELNGAFAALLRALGFRVTLLSARVAREDGSYGPEFDHLTLRVDLDRSWLADVGFGECFLEPLRLESGMEQSQDGRLYRLTLLNSEDGSLGLEAMVGGKWKAQYAFTLEAHQLSEFAGMCHYHQTSPESHFTRQRICSLATPGGRVTLSDGKLIETRGGSRQQRPLALDKQWLLTLREQFGVILPAEADL